MDTDLAGPICPVLRFDRMRGGADHKVIPDLRRKTPLQTCLLGCITSQTAEPASWFSPPLPTAIAVGIFPSLVVQRIRLRPRRRRHDHCLSLFISKAEYAHFLRMSRKTYAAAPYCLARNRSHALRARAGISLAPASNPSTLRSQSMASQWRL